MKSNSKQAATTLIDWNDFLPDLVTTFGVQEGVKPCACADAMVVAALRADALVLLQVGLVEHRFATGAFDPQSFGHLATYRGIGLLDFGRQKFFKPGHARSSVGWGQC